MRISCCSILALWLGVAAQQTVAKSLFTHEGLHRRTDLNNVFGRAEVTYERRIGSRTPQNQHPPPEASGAAAGSSSGQLQIGSTPTEVNSTTTAACDAKVAEIGTVTNPAGFAGCYNILSFDPVTSQFQSDLRIYSKGQPSGQFAGLDRKAILVLLNFPSSTSFKSLQKRTINTISKRQDPGTAEEFQQFSLTGSITTPIDMKKLDELQVASLLTPQVAMQSTTNGQTFAANMTTEDMAMFVTGQFADISSRAKEVADPNTATAAIAAAKGFVLPGTTFGIFPIGLIVTGSWTVIFIAVYGAGTIGRLRYRDMYRKRAAAASGFSYNQPGIGKL